MIDYRGDEVIELARLITRAEAHKPGNFTEGCRAHLAKFRTLSTKQKEVLLSMAEEGEYKARQEKRQEIRASSHDDIMDEAIDQFAPPF